MNTNDTVYAVSDKVMTEGEDLVIGFRFTRILRDTETLSGSPTVTADITGLTISTPAVNVAPFDDDSQPPIAVEVGKGVEVRIVAPPGSKGTYVLTCLCPTSAGRIRGVKGNLIVQ